MSESLSLHLPRKRKPILTVGRVRLLAVLAGLAIWALVIWAVRRALGG